MTTDDRDNRQDLPDELREFVYLDDTSVVSLLTSIKPGLTETVVNELSNSNDASGEFGARVGFGGAQLSGGVKSGTAGSESAQITRRAVAQSHFRELWRELSNGQVLSLRPASRRDPVSSIDELARMLEDLAQEGLLIPLTRIFRGELFDADVRLEASNNYRLRLIAESIRGMVQDNRTMQTLLGDDPATFVDTVDFLVRLLGDSVPVRALVLNFRVLQVHGVGYLVHETLLKPGSDLMQGSSDLYIEAATSASSYWVEPRTVLFSGESFRVLGRARGPVAPMTGESAELNVLSRVAPVLADQFSVALRAAYTNVVEGNPVAPKKPAGSGPALEALKRVVDQHDFPLGAQPTDSELAVLTVEFETVEQRRIAFDRAFQMIEERCGVQVPKADRHGIRTAALSAAGFSAVNPTPPASGGVGPPDRVDLPVESGANGLSASVIATWW
ncbi:hypothetical protein [Blastococcus sp. Marseille-P5729]|uniref:DUF6414 family protein n=1 Tax=Blastococcus sp. Marseille-P5729 TaxID=2086582 RepID=UPI000D0EF56F|nr:hypothetical protein [Blastococcus sp. Marseille-P5729]